MKIIKDKASNLLIEITPFNFIAYVKNANFEGFALKYKVGETWYYQHLMLSVRAGAKTYFKASKQLYSYIKKNKLTNKTFKQLAV